ncbi:hypothetical protein, partial [Phascolarctobacterium succinatutens]|uniref:hypothetical protein n=1 Tax=Phascolarctobacterium succinatutens TaxID=626940 RepID=UPI0026EF82D1
KRLVELILNRYFLYNKKAALPGGFFIVALPHPCNKLHTIKLEEKENLKNLYVTEQQIVRFA